MSTAAALAGQAIISPTPPAPRLTLVSGRWVEGQGAEVRRICNPADTAEVLADVREASAAQVDEACAAAAAAFPAWRSTPPADRARVLFRFRELLEANFLDLARGIVR